MKKKRAKGGWKIYFDAKNASLNAVHKSGCRIKGRLSIIAQQINTGPCEWTLAEAERLEPGEFRTLDTNGECQGYISIRCSGETLQLEFIRRCMRMLGKGTFVFEGVAELGKRTFSCRTQPCGEDRVIQMSSGPADSLLNDSLFDIDKDTALQLKADNIMIQSSEKSGKFNEKFSLSLKSALNTPKGCFIAFDLKKDFYRSRYIPYYRAIDKKRNPFPLTGWMSWNSYFDKAGEKENLAEARIAAEKLKPYGLKIWLIESWQENSDVLPPDIFHNLGLKHHPGQFPHGMKWLAKEINKLGFIPGIWVVAFGTGDEKFYREHKSWFLHNPDGTPIGNWAGKFVLDPSQKEVRKFMGASCRKMKEDWGYKFFKIDGLSGGGSDYSAHFLQRADVIRAFRHRCQRPLYKCLSVFRKSVGSRNILLACCGHYTGPEVAFCEAARIGGDVVSPNQPPQWINYVKTVLSILANAFVHNIIWYNDPDTLMVAESMPVELARIAATLVALPGYVMFSGDKLGELSEDRIRLIQRCLPVCDVRPLDLFPVFIDDPAKIKPVWVLKISRPFGCWDIVSLFNWQDEAKDIGFTMQEIGLDLDKEYLAYDFWNKRFIGTSKERFKTNITPHSNMLISLSVSLGRPQLLSTDRHITQVGVSLSALKWNEKNLVLEGKSQLVANDPIKLTFYVPHGFDIVKVTANDVETKLPELKEDRTAILTLKSKSSISVYWHIGFRKKEL